MKELLRVVDPFKLWSTAESATLDTELNYILLSCLFSKSSELGQEETQECLSNTQRLEKLSNHLLVT